MPQSQTTIPDLSETNQNDEDRYSEYEGPQSPNIQRTRHSGAEAPSGLEKTTIHFNSGEQQYDFLRKIIYSQLLKLAVIHQQTFRRITADDRSEPKLQNAALCPKGWETRKAAVGLCKNGPYQPFIGYATPHCSFTKPVIRHELG